MNRNAKEDKKAKLIYAGKRGESVIEYVIGNEKTKKKIRSIGSIIRSGRKESGVGLSSDYSEYKKKKRKTGKEETGEKEKNGEGKLNKIGQKISRIF